MKIAIVHEYLVQYGGAERVLECLHKLYPDAPVYTMIYDPTQIRAFYRDWDIRTIPSLDHHFIKKNYKTFFFIYPVFIEKFDLREYDVVISSSYAYAHGIITSPNCCHICYCHTPMRFAWVKPEEYRASMPYVSRWLYDWLIHMLRLWDLNASQRPDYYIAASENVARRITKYYQRESTVIVPPVDTDKFRPVEKKKDFYLIVSRLVSPYKKIDLAIQAFNKLGYPLKIVGDGTGYNYLKNMAKENIEFVGRLYDRELVMMYSSAKALVFPSDDDFGIVPVEANACGCPVIALKSGGIMESQIENKTCIYYEEDTVDDLVEAVKRFETMTFDPQVIRESALRFDRLVFMQKFKEIVDTAYQHYPSYYQFKVIH